MRWQTFPLCPIAITTFALFNALPFARSEWAAQPSRRDEVKATFQYNYAKYEEHAFGYDVLMPISKSGGNNRILAGFGGTIVDSMSTMLIMGMENSSEYQRALEHVRKIDFSKCNTGNPAGTVSLFELTIRYLGGLISAYDLAGRKQEHRFLIDKASELADRLSHAWVNGNRIPFNKVMIDAARYATSHSPATWRGSDDTQPAEAALIAEAGTLLLEWHSLSELTSNKTYSRLATQAMDAIIESEPIFPGLWAQEIWADKEIAKGDYVSWGGGSDSMMEYLPKFPFLIGKDKHKYLEVFKRTVQSTIKHLRVKTGVHNLTFTIDHSLFRGDGPIYVHSHLACFGGGNVAFGGRLLGRDDWVQFGLEWAESCAHTYRQSVTGIGPTGWGFYDGDGKSPGWDYVSPARRAFYNDNGYFISFNSWNHQPEVMESIFYAWRITGQEFWRDLAWDMFLSMRLHCDTGEGWSGIRNINDISAGAYDETQTFLYAELLKYLYLIFDDPEHISLDEYVFNTEAHPQRRKPGGNFPKVQGTNFPYKPVVTNVRSVVPTAFPHRVSSAVKTLSLQQPDKDSGISNWKLFGIPFSISGGTCSSHAEAGNSRNKENRLLAPNSWAEGIAIFIYCHSRLVLLVPFAILVSYWLAIRIHKSLLRQEKSLYSKA